MTAKIWAFIHAERQVLADDMSGLTHDQWSV
jgi:hypothetical protein